MDWKQDFGEFLETNLYLKDEFQVLTNEGIRDVVDPLQDLYDEGESFWSHCLIGQFLGAPPPLYLIKNMIYNAWWKFGRVDLYPKGKGLFMFKFEKEEYCQKVLQQLWHVSNRPLLLRKWQPQLEFINFSCNKVPIWVKMKDVPLSLWSKRGFSYLASFIGKPIQIDALTESRRNLEFARVCIEVNLEENLPNEIYPKLRDGSRARVSVEYAWKPNICTHCKMVGHLEDHCPSRPKIGAQKTLEANKANSSKINDTWKVVGKKKSSQERNNQNFEKQNGMDMSTATNTKGEKALSSPKATNKMETKIGNTYKSLEVIEDSEEGELDPQWADGGHEKNQHLHGNNALGRGSTSLPME